MTTKYVRLKDCDPAVNPGWMEPEQYAAEVAKDSKNLERRVRLTVPS